VSVFQEDVAREEKSLQAMIEARGLEIFRRMEGRKPSAFSQRNLAGKLMNWSIRNEGLHSRRAYFPEVQRASIARSSTSKQTTSISIAESQAPS
jgi:hypothetical protein